MIFDFRIKDVIDILIVAILLYQTYRLLRGTSGMNVFIGVLSFIVVWFFVSFVFQMELLGSIMNKFVSVGAIALIVLFQEEIRRFMAALGGRKKAKGFVGRIKKILLGAREGSSFDYTSEIVQACEILSKTKTGALIVIQNDADLSKYWGTGERIESYIKARLIENIFFKNSPLHDGALIIVNNRIKAVGCILPIAHNQDLPKHLGLRHRAALGISQKTDATTIVVSEETGRISLSEVGELHLNLTPEKLELFLTKGVRDEDKNSTFVSRKNLSKNYCHANKF